MATHEAGMFLSIIKSDTKKRKSFQKEVLPAVAATTGDVQLFLSSISDDFSDFKANMSHFSNAIMAAVVSDEIKMLNAVLSRIEVAFRKVMCHHVTVGKGIRQALAHTLRTYRTNRTSMILYGVLTHPTFVSVDFTLGDLFKLCVTNNAKFIVPIIQNTRRQQWLGGCTDTEQRSSLRQKEVKFLFEHGSKWFVCRLIEQGTVGIDSIGGTRPLAIALKLGR
ncbi:hypothetical protein BU25DRAFT_424919 [Macroventuria anomochaeta]|uniref:Uncharacterized protein n=1 Tax=Macroventuria anomochaeta TaxID=301207 RepID=A0ACB6RR43_9PLEO|nr:uncharacterized protein BU25DRAFT_424919 [Macroventuria anomochaeta]KAF2623407.1 hypothetical protein BU25DRAFT_424919 [Macroventuria anomochaeta]